MKFFFILILLFGLAHAQGPRLFSPEEEMLLSDYALIEGSYVFSFSNQCRMPPGNTKYWLLMSPTPGGIYPTSFYTYECSQGNSADLSYEISVIDLHKVSVIDTKSGKPYFDNNFLDLFLKSNETGLYLEFTGKTLYLENTKDNLSIGTENNMANFDFLFYLVTNGVLLFQDNSSGERLRFDSPSPVSEVDIYYQGNSNKTPQKLVRVGDLGENVNEPIYYVTFSGDNKQYKLVPSYVGAWLVYCTNPDGTVQTLGLD